MVSEGDIQSPPLSLSVFISLKQGLSLNLDLGLTASTRDPFVSVLHGAGVTGTQTALPSSLHGAETQFQVLLPGQQILSYTAIYAAPKVGDYGQRGANY